MKQTFTKNSIHTTIDSDFSVYVIYLLVNNKKIPIYYGKTGDTLITRFKKAQHFKDKSGHMVRKVEYLHSLYGGKRDIETEMVKLKSFKTNPPAKNLEKTLIAKNGKNYLLLNIQLNAFKWDVVKKGKIFNFSFKSSSSEKQFKGLYKCEEKEA